MKLLAVLAVSEEDEEVEALVARRWTCLREEKQLLVAAAVGWGLREFVEENRRLAEGEA